MTRVRLTGSQTEWHPPLASYWRVRRAIDWTGIVWRWLTAESGFLCKAIQQEDGQIVAAVGWPPRRLDIWLSPPAAPQAILGRVLTPGQATWQHRALTPEALIAALGIMLKDSGTALASQPRQGHVICESRKSRRRRRLRQSPPAKGSS